MNYVGILDTSSSSLKKYTTNLILHKKIFMQIFRISYQEITFLCLLNIQTVCSSVNLHGL